LHLFFDLRLDVQKKEEAAIREAKLRREWNLLFEWAYNRVQNKLPWTVTPGSVVMKEDDGRGVVEYRKEPRWQRGTDGA
jgi:hypothetical protein